MCSQGIAAPSHSWSLGSLFPRTGWSFDSNRKTQTNHPIPRMISHSQVPGRNRHPKDPARSCSRIMHLEAKSVRNKEMEFVPAGFAGDDLAASAAGFCARTRPPGTEFLDAETGHQKSLLKYANGRRDQNPGSDWPEIPAETPYSASDRKPAVCGDWMVVCAVRYEPVSPGHSPENWEFFAKFSK